MSVEFAAHAGPVRAFRLEVVTMDVNCEFEIRSGQAPVEIREALQEPITNIVNALRETLEQTPPELAADIVDRGIYLTGGGGLLRGLNLLLREVTNLSVHVAEDALTCVVRGAGSILEHPRDFEKVLLNSHRD